MASDRDEVRKRLVLSTISAIEELGLARVTVRAITQAAEVNVASINYYFGSKEQLINAALNETLEHMMGDLAEIRERLSAAPQEVSAELLLYLLEGALQYPNVTRAHLRDMPGDTKAGALPSGFAPVVKALASAIAQEQPGLSRERGLNRAVSSICSVLFPGFFPGFFGPAGALKTQKARRRYVDELVAGLFVDAGSGS